MIYDYELNSTAIRSRTNKNEYIIYLSGINAENQKTDKGYDYYSAGLFHRLVNMKLDSGRGNIFPEIPNRITADFWDTVEAFTTPNYYYYISKVHTHDIDWIITRSIDTLLAFPYTSNGIGTPVKSIMRECTDPYGRNDARKGEIVFSNDRSFAVAINYCYSGFRPGGNFSIDTVYGPFNYFIDTSFLYAYDFDTLTGKFSNQRLLDLSITTKFGVPTISYVNYFAKTYSGVAFSPNDSIFYVGVSGYREFLNDSFRHLMQFQRYAPDIRESKYEFKIKLSIPNHECCGDWSFTRNLNYTVSDIALGANGKVYFAIGLDSTEKAWLGMIRYPDSIGEAAQVKPQVYPLTYHYDESTFYIYSLVRFPKNYASGICKISL